MSLTWMASIIQFCWQRWWYTLWKTRNQEVHGHDERSRAEAAKRDVRYQLDNTYCHRSMYETHVQRLLHRDARVHDQQALSVTKNWLSVNRSIFQDSYRRVKQHYVACNPFGNTSVTVEPGTKQKLIFCNGGYYTPQCIAHPCESISLSTINYP